MEKRWTPLRSKKSRGKFEVLDLYEARYIFAAGVVSHFITP